MSATSNFVTSREEYIALHLQASEVFRLNSGGFPEQVFAEGFGHFRFLEFDVMFSPEFWRTLAGCVECYGDEEVSLFVHDPDPEEYYFSHFGRFGVARFHRRTTADSYYEALQIEPEGSPADALLYIASTVSWCGNSKQWAFWGERDLGIGVAAVRQTSKCGLDVGLVPEHDVECVIRNWLPLSFKDRIVPESFAMRLRANYGA